MKYLSKKCMCIILFLFNVYFFSFFFLHERLQAHYYYDKENYTQNDINTVSFVYPKGAIQTYAITVFTDETGSILFSVPEIDSQKKGYWFYWPMYKLFEMKDWAVFPNEM